MGKDIVLIGNLSKHEAQQLAQLLTQARISCNYKEEGYGHMLRMKYGHNSEDRHVLFIDEADEERAIPVLQKFREDNLKRIEKKERICPKCGHDEVALKPLNLFQRLYYLGTRPKICPSCGNQWL